MNGSVSSAATKRLRWLAIMAAATAVGTTTRAEAQFWPDYPDSPYAYQHRHRQIHRQKPHKHVAARKEAHKETGPKPQGPLLISISIDRQKVTIYDSNGVFAESPVSTGMRGHPTPMGVFSIIEKQRFHRSNIYSGAPMPYMQRITWSGVAMHAGVLPGYPASHGCIRMPPTFAVKMYHWTRLGARVIVTPGEMTPSSFSHPLLASTKVPPQPTASPEPDKGAPEVKSANAEPAIELKSTIGDVAVHDATTSSPQAHDEVATPADKAAGPASEEASKETPKEPTKEPTKEPATTESSTRAADVSDPTKSSSDETKPEQSSNNNDAKTKEPADAKLIEKPVETATAPTNSDTKPIEAERRPDAPAVATTRAPDSKKDQANLPAPTPIVKPEAPKRAGQIAVFISRKDAKIYVRQNFAPLFEAPVTITPSDRPLGTHVFTAETDEKDTNTLRWSVVSLPASRSDERSDGGRISRHHHRAAVIPVAEKPAIIPDSPSEALDRITIPEDTMAKVNELLTTGASIVISDQGINQGETGKGTDFIVRWR